MKNNFQQAHQICLGEKNRMNIPTQARPIFHKHIAFGVFTRYGIILHPDEQEGVFSDYSIDQSNGRILLGEGIFDLVGATKTNPNEALWIPKRVRLKDTTKYSVSFLLLLGLEGKESWLKMLERQTLITDLLERNQVITPR